VNGAVLSVLDAVTTFALGVLGALGQNDRLAAVVQHAVDVQEVGSSSLRLVDH
jgi:hypothetical protein